MDQSSFEPDRFRIVSESREMKAFSDPLRIRMLQILAEREATNQQLARAFDQPQARVFHHLRTLLELGLIILVRQEVSGGNVEKYYRAVARSWVFRPDPGEPVTYTGAIFNAVAENIAAAEKRWPEEMANFELRRARISAARRAEFDQRLNELLKEFWGSPDTPIEQEAGEPLYAVACAVYRLAAFDD